MPRTRIVLILYAIPLWVSLALLVLPPIWARLLLAGFSVVLVVANLDTLARIRAVTQATGSTALLVNEIVSTVAVVALISVPWALGGLRPSRQDLSWAIVLSLAAGFLSTCALVMSAFDSAHGGRAGESTPRGPSASEDPMVTAGQARRHVPPSAEAGAAHDDGSHESGA